MARASLTDEEILAQIPSARERARADDLTQPRAVSARYDEGSGRVELELRNGCLFAFPAALVEGLRGAPAERIAAVCILADGAVLRWDALDVDLGVPELLEGRFGSKRWLAQWGGSGWNARPEPPAAAEPIEEVAIAPHPEPRRKAS